MIFFIIWLTSLCFFSSFFESPSFSVIPLDCAIAAGCLECAQVIRYFPRIIPRPSTLYPSLLHFAPFSKALNLSSQEFFFLSLLVSKQTFIVLTSIKIYPVFFYLTEVLSSPHPSQMFRTRAVLRSGLSTLFHLSHKIYWRTLDIWKYHFHFSNYHHNSHFFLLCLQSSSTYF